MGVQKMTQAEAVLYPLLLLLLSGQVSSLCPWKLPGLKNWSDSSTWGGHPPQDGDTVTVTTPILLDTQTPRIKLLDIRDGGMVVFSPQHETKLTVGIVRLINNGSLLIGSPECRFEGRADIVLTGEEGPDVTMGELTKGVYVKHGGHLDIHGEDKLSWTKLVETLEPDGSGEYVIKLADIPVGWRPGDKLVIASTDFDMHEAEEVEIVECSSCLDAHLFCACFVKGDIRYKHYGEIYKGVDMRAEVGLLSRNIKIQGEAKDHNDTYGGHLKAYKGFETFRIRGAELTKMGQRGIKGRYPIHFHMALEVDSEKAYAMENSIHHVFQRCITVHGTHGVNIVDNVAYSTFGHCYFLEDGGEKNNSYHHNLGLVTQAMVNPSTIPSDRQPATFWITSPLTSLTQNSAAGSDGMGIWFIFANKVTGPSANEGFFEEGEAFRTPIKLFDTNTVHSNVDTGFMFGHELLEDQDFSGPGGTEKCNPRQDPLDKESDPATHFVKRLTAFKNIKQNVWNDCRNTTWEEYKSSDAFLGLTMKHDNTVLDSIFIGESTNIGEPNIVRTFDGVDTMWNRSTPGYRQGLYIGLQLYDGNPLVNGTTFADFYNDDWKIAGAIGFRKPHAGGIPTLFLNSHFDFVDKIEGNYIRGLPKHSYPGVGAKERGIVLDWDGTITGYPRSTVVRDEPIWTSRFCIPYLHWGNMSVCPHRYTGSGGTGSGYNKLDVVVTRDDVPDYPLVAMANSDAWHLEMSTDHSYIWSFRNSSLPRNYHFMLHGLSDGLTQNIGFCVPPNASPDEISFTGRTKLIELDTYEDLQADQTGSAFYWDREVGVVFTKFLTEEERTPADRRKCFPADNLCPDFRIRSSMETMGDTDCTARAYPKYRKDPL